MKIIIAGLILAAGFVSAAEISEPLPSFDAASVRRAEGEARPDTTTSPGSLTIRNRLMLDLISWAYFIPPLQITGPEWIREARFDVVAKSDSGGDDARLRLMLQRLLAERFGLKSHNEKKEMSVYALTLVKTGPKFQESTDEGPPVFNNGGPGILTAHRATMADLAVQISGPLRTPIVDETGLKGKYEIRIDVRGFMQSTGDNGPTTQADIMSVLFNALPAQLGVKLVSKKAVIDMLTIDSLEKDPTAN